MKVADEANPLMASLIETDPRLFLLVKVMAVTLSCIILWTLRAHRLAKIIAILATLLYIGIICWHVIGAWDAGIVEVPTQRDFIELYYESKDVLEHFLAQVLDQLPMILNK